MIRLLVEPTCAGVPVIHIDARVLVGIYDVIDHRVITAAGQLDPGRIGLDHREIFSMKYCY